MTNRIIILLASTTALAACGGAGPQSAGSVPVSSTPTTGGSATPTPTASFVNPTDAKTYDGIGVAQHYEYKTRSDGSGQYAQLYAGDANTARNSGIAVTYDPRDAIFELTINREKAIVTPPGTRFQDPAHRIDFGGASEPQVGVPDLGDAKKIQYLQTAAGPQTGGAASVRGSYPVGQDGYAGGAQTFFYQKPGTSTKFVTYAGYVRNLLTTTKQTKTVTDPATGVATDVEYLENTYSFDRALFAYGERSVNSVVPKTGSGSYTGDMLATLVYNPSFDKDVTSPTYFQWLSGTNTTTIDFGTLGVTMLLNGTVTAPSLDAYTSGKYVLPGGSTFVANGKGAIDLVGKGGFVGSFTDAKFTKPSGSDLVVTIAGSSFDGAFFGPAAEEIGGGFRIVGATPDQRVDILGVYTGKK